MAKLETDAGLDVFITTAAKVGVNSAEKLFPHIRELAWSPDGPVETDAFDAPPRFEDVFGAAPAWAAGPG